jgi:hypothetical protein
MHVPHHPWRRIGASLLLLLLSLGAARADAPIALAIRNDGSVALRCMILFGHWITQDIGPIPPGGSARLSLWRGLPAGALYIPRFDGRQMMIENLICGSDDAWAETYDQIPLLPLRTGSGHGFRTDCSPAGRIACTPPLVTEP